MSHLEPRPYIIGSMMKQSAGQTISIFVQVKNIRGRTLEAATTDKLTLNIELPTELSVGPGSWVEVIGIPQSGNAIRANEVIEFGGENIDFDAEGYTGMAHMLNNVKNFYRYG